MSRGQQWRLHHYETLTSTMDRAAVFARLGAPERTAVVCEEQTAGRGRDGRVWKSSPGSAIYATLILRPAIPPSRLSPLSLITGVAVAEAIESLTATPVRLKWPNDVWLGQNPNNQKVAGILVTSSLLGPTIDHVLVGIGINISASPTDLPDGATSILAATGRHVAPAVLLAELLDRIDAGYGAFLTASGRPALDDWSNRAALLGEEVAIQEGGQRIAGLFTGVDADGALLLDLGNGQMRRVVAGDLVRGPRKTATAAQPAPAR